MKRLFLLFLTVATTQTFAQNRMTPELLWELGRVGGVQVSPENHQILFGITYYNIDENKGNRDLYVMSVDGGTSKKITAFSGSEFNAVWRPDGKKIGFLSAESGSVQLWEVNPDGSDMQQVSKIEGGINGFKYGPNGKMILYTKDVKMDPTVNEMYPDLEHAEARVINDLMYRHWDNWHDYSYSHIFYTKLDNGTYSGGVDIMKGERYDSPLNPFGGMEQICWNGDGSKIYYTCKKMSGKEYAESTNSEIYAYDLGSGETSTVTDNPGYDVQPSFNGKGGKLAYLQMKRDGYESDKNDIIVMDVKSGEKTNLTAHKDITVDSYVWGDSGDKIYFECMTGEATRQLFEVSLKDKEIRQVTKGRHNYTSIEDAGDYLIGTRQSMIQPNEIFRVEKKKGKQEQLTFVNKKIIDKLEKPVIEKRMIQTTDGKQMLTWVIKPPKFDENKKYRTLLYCQGGPQSTVSQFFSFRWNFHLMAAQGYVIVAPNRRGLPGFGQEWNEQISGDWGGQAMDDYLSAIDEVKKEPWADEDNLGCIGASYGGYSVYYLAGIHEGRFNTFVSHCGLFNLESWYGSTEELFFANWDIGGPYWGEKPPKSYKEYSPHKLADNWDTPILVIHGQRDYRVPVTQGMEAFQLAQIKGIPSKFLYFPDEGHWVLSPQNGLVWHREFFTWLGEYLK